MEDLTKLTDKQLEDILRQNINANIPGSQNQRAQAEYNIRKKI